MGPARPKLVHRLGSHTAVMSSPALPVRYFTLTWALRVEHGGMPAALLRRSRMFAAGFGTMVTVLTFDSGGDYDEVRAGLAARGLLGPGVEVLNLWEWLSALPGVAEVSEERTPPVRGGRGVRLYAPDGSVLRDWGTAWAVYTFWLNSLRGGAPAVMIADSKPAARFLSTYRRRNVLTAHVVHGSHLDDSGRELSRTRRSQLDRIDDFDLVALLTRQQRRDLVSRIGRRPNLRVLPNIVDLASAAFRRAERRGGVVVASLTARKRVGHAIRAVDKARDAGILTDLDVFGDGPQRAALEASSPAVRFHGHVPGAGSGLSGYLYLLLTSTAEGSPLCVLEALAAGCLPIAYDIPFGPADVIRDGVNGFLVAAGDTDALAAKIVELHRMPDVAVEQMRRDAVATVAAYQEAEVLERWHRELRAAWRRKTWLCRASGGRFGGTSPPER